MEEGEEKKRKTGKGGIERRRERGEEAGGSQVVRGRAAKIHFPIS